MGKGRVLFTSAIFSAFLIGLLANSFSAQAGGNCQSKLVGNTYNCDQSEQGFAGGPFTAEFETGGYSEYFDMFIRCRRIRMRLQHDRLCRISEVR